MFKNLAIELLAEPLRQWELAPWLDFLLEKENLKFNPKAKQLFFDFMGTNLMEIQMELKKLKTYIGKRKEISEDDVKSSTSYFKIEQIFELTEAIGKKDLTRSLRALAFLLDQNQNAIGVLTMLARHIRNLAKFQEGKKENLTQTQLIEKTGIPRFFLKNLYNQAPLWSKEHINQTMRALYETDKALKSSSLSSHIWLENFILKTCR